MSCTQYSAVLSYLFHAGLNFAEIALFLFLKPSWRQGTSDFWNTPHHTHTHLTPSIDFSVSVRFSWGFPRPSSLVNYLITLLISQSVIDRLYRSRHQQHSKLTNYQFLASTPMLPLACMYPSTTTTHPAGVIDSKLVGQNPPLHTPASTMLERQSNSISQFPCSACSAKKFPWAFFPEKEKKERKTLKEINPWIKILEMHTTI